MIKNKVIAVDFDGTLTTQNIFPNIAPLRKGAKECIDSLRMNGNKVVLWTCRTGESLFQAIDFLRQNGIELDDYNSNPFYPYSVYCRKIVADFYIDDRNIFMQEIDWYKIFDYFSNL